MGFRIVIDTDNASFDNGGQQAEVIRIVREAMSRMEREPFDDLVGGHFVTLFDGNGNNVGELEYNPTFHAGGPKKSDDDFYRELDRATLSRELRSKRLNRR